jgi:hypothetical protein
MRPHGCQRSWSIVPPGIAMPDRSPRAFSIGRSQPLPCFRLSGY